MRARGGVVVATIVLSLGLGAGLGACGGGGNETPPATPGGNVDPNAKGVIGGSINKAKAVGATSEERDAQLEQQGGGGATP